MSVAVHGEAHFAGGELGPAGVFGLGEGRVGVLAGECEHAAHGRHPQAAASFTNVRRDTPNVPWS